MLPVDQAIAAFEQRQLDTTCPRCRGQNWDVKVVALEASSFLPHQSSQERFRIPTVVLTCHQCGNMYLHNLAVLLGPTANRADTNSPPPAPTDVEVEDVFDVDEVMDVDDDDDDGAGW